MICNVILHSQVVDTVNSHSAIESVMDCVVSNIGCMYCADHMEVDRIRAENEGLAYVVKLNAVNPCCRGLITR